MKLKYKKINILINNFKKKERRNYMQERKQNEEENKIAREHTLNRISSACQ